jgi:DNA repair exonuclease SbcCD nuclease subunit
MEYNKKSKRAWIVSDTHFGCRSNSKEWIEIIENYFYNFFIPLVEKEYREGDILFHLGDVFDNRQSINLLVQHSCLNVFEKLSEIFPEIHVIVGNHDLYRKKSNEVTSVDLLKHIPNVTVYKEPKELILSNKKVLLMPWRRDAEHEKETLKEFPNSEYVFCHSEVSGLQLSKNPKNKHHGGNDVKNYKNYKQVYSGHIHYRQRKNNFCLVGNPYQMTRSDTGNKKGVYLIDFENEKEQFFENNYSPEFLKININHIQELTIEKLKKRIKNNFVDLYISSEIASKYDLASLMKLLDGYARRIEPQIYESESEIDLLIETESESYKGMDILNLSKKFLELKDYQEDLNNKILNTLKELYEEAKNN